MARTRQAISSHDSALLVLPTGGGKGSIAAIMGRGAADKNLRSVFMAHRIEIVDQLVSTLQSVGVEPGVIATGYPEHANRLVQVASVQTLSRPKRLFMTPAPSLLVIDEAQHAIAKQWKTIRSVWSTSKVVGLSATPIRLDGQGLGDVFESMVEGPDVAWLIANNYLAPYRAFAPSRPQTAQLPMAGGDYTRAANEALMNKPSITGDAVSTYMKYVYGKPAIAFCVSVKHSMEVAAAFCAVGIVAVHVDGDTPRDVRRQIMTDFRAGKIDVLCNVEVFTEGTDCPGAEVGIFLRPTASYGLWRQMVGRILRYQPGKVAWLFDHAGNFEKHGLPDDPITWSLQGTGKKSRGDLESAMAVRTCPACYAVSPASKKTCERCGSAFPLTPREVKKLEGELREIQKIKARRQLKDEKRGAKTIEQLVDLAKRRGYKNPTGWARLQMEFRERHR